MTHTRFRIEELSVGWMYWQVRGPGIKEDIHASWVGHPTLDLMLRLATTMLTFRREGYFWHLNMNQWEDFTVSFPGEPECYQATFHKPEGEAVDFTLEKSDDDMGSSHAPYRETGKGTVNITEFADDLLADSAALLRENGFVGFHEAWQHEEFPIAELLRLVAVRNGREPFRAGLVQELKDLMETTGASKTPEHISEDRGRPSENAQR